VILGLTSYELNIAERELLQNASKVPYGFILFKHNIQSISQVQRLIADLRKVCKRPIKICIDEEGGRVSRLTSSGIVPKSTFLPAQDFYQGNLPEAIKAVEENYYNIGRHLKELDIDINFAPVADLFYQEAHGVIGNRSFGASPEVVIALCLAAMQGLKKAEVTPCIKHLPGHGLAKVDSHVALPVVDQKLAYLANNDFMVFKNLADSAEFAMLAHVVYNCLDASMPVTTSKAAIEYIRSHLGFAQKTLITDCITMGALYNEEPTYEHKLEKIEQSLAAGSDIVIYAQGDWDEKILNIGTIT
jgi:beta-glucosidase